MAQKEQTKEIELDKLLIDEDLYPRKEPNWMVAYQYQKAMEAGNVFPPILVGLYNNKYYIVDGWHRHRATKLLKKKTILAHIKAYTNRKEMFLDAIKTNSTHGHGFTVFDKTKMLLRAKDFQIPQLNIAQILGIPSGSIKQFVVDRIAVTTTGYEVPLKGSMKEVYAGRQISTELADEQEHIFAHSQLQLINELILLIKSKSVDVKNPKVINALKTLEKLIKEMG